MAARTLGPRRLSCPNDEPVSSSSAWQRTRWLQISTPFSYPRSVVPSYVAATCIQSPFTARCGCNAVSKWIGLVRAGDGRDEVSLKPEIEVLPLRDLVLPGSHRVFSRLTLVWTEHPRDDRQCTGTSDLVPVGATSGTPANEGLPSSASAPKNLALVHTVSALRRWR